MLTVHGSFMDAVAEPIMQITRKIKEHKEIYSVVSSNQSTLTI